MKKLAGLLIVLLCMLAVFATSCAEPTADLAAMTDDELVSLILDCRTALTERKINPETVLYQDEELGITISINGYRIDTYTSFIVDGTVINRSDKEVRVSAKYPKVYINNWEIGFYSNVMVTAEPGRNAKGEVFKTFKMSDNTDVSSPKDLSIIEGVYLITIGSEQIEIPFVITDFSSIK